MASSDHSAASPAASIFGNLILATGGREDRRRGSSSRHRHHPYKCKISEAQRTGTNAQSKSPIQTLTRATVNAIDRQKLREIRNSVEETNPNIQRPPLSEYSFFHHPSLFNKPHSARGDRSHANQRRGAILRTLSPAQLSFRKNVLYTIEEPVTDVKICDVTDEPRTISVPISCKDGSALQKRINNPSYQVGIFCAAGLEDIQDIAFPEDSTIKVDGLEGKASFGRKDKPGSVAPIDISKGLRLRPGPAHTVELTYGPTTNEFYLVISLCKKRSIEEALDDITKREKISMTPLYPDLRFIAQDPDIVATSQALTLMCPLSKRRLELPCRGLNCKHLQCFDATTYIQLQEQSPQWECPICYNYLPSDALAVDGYMENILHRTPKSQQRVIIDANGQWHANPSNRWSLSAEGCKAPVIDLTLSRPC